jgi:SanA protein
MTGKKYVKAALYIVAAALAAVVLINMTVLKTGREGILTAGSFAGCQVAIVPGAYVTPDGKLCDMLADRVGTAVDLYKSGKVDKILMTGDHGRASYDEVNSMRKFAEAEGVPTGDIFMDHAGFSTYDSMYRARDVFQVDSAVIVTQNFHLPRAVYIARQLGVDAVGISADRHIYAGAQVYGYREIPARIKAFVQVAAGWPPKFLGPAIPVNGDGRATHDQL